MLKITGKTMNQSSQRYLYLDSYIKKSVHSFYKTRLTHFLFLMFILNKAGPGCNTGPWTSAGLGM